jgi:succinoglycan biosynthesis transport protein ExoP
VELLQYWRLFLRNRFIIFLCVIFGLVASGAITFLTVPTYESRAQIFVSTPASTLDISALATGSSFSQQRVKSYAQIVNSPLTLLPVINQLGLDVSPEELSTKITASAPLDTVLITLSVIDSDPQLAAGIANAVAEQFGSTVADLELRSTELDSPVKVSIVKFATPSLEPVSPVLAINLFIGFILGFLFGFSIAALRQILDNTVKNEDDLLDKSLLGTISFDTLAQEKPLVTQIGRYSARAEAFRTLRTNIQYIAPNSHPQVIVVTSALPGEGKSTSAANLALSLKQAGANTILVEADLRRPKIPTYLSVPESHLGISQLLTSEKKITLASIRKLILKDPATGLEMLLSGLIPSNPAEALGSAQFDVLLSLLRKSYEYIIIDCPPLLLVTDAAVVAAKSDGALLVVHAGVTKKPHFKGSCQALSAVGAQVIGVVLNKIPETSLDFEYGYRYGHGRYYGTTYRANANGVGANNYVPRADDLARLELEERLQGAAGMRFKMELLRENQEKVKK